MKEYKILSVKEQELPLCLETIRKAFAEKVSEFGYSKENYPYCAAFLTLDDLVAAKKKKIHMYAAWVGDVPAGYVQLEKRAEGVYSFQRFSVLPEYQHFGIGRALISHCRSRAISFGAKKLTLLMRYENKPLFEFYKKCGFVLARLGKDQAHPFEFALMEMDLEKQTPVNTKYRSYLFDLDGTLTDPGLGIKNSIRYALDKFGLTTPEDSVLDNFIGPPLLDSFAKYCGASPEEAKTLLSLYREYFSVKGLFENEIYDGVLETLAALKKGGATLCLATSKPEPYAKKIVEHFGIAKYLDFVGGSTMDETRTKKDEVIAYVLESTGIRAGEAVMVGDRKYDVEGGTACGLDTVGVTFGYGSREELDAATYIIKSFPELLNI